MNELKCSCGNNIEFRKHKQCSICEMKSTRQFQEDKFKELIEGKDFVRCKCVVEGVTCNWPDVMLTRHLQIIHKLNKHTYYKQYSSAAIICDNVKKKLIVTGARSESAKENMSRAHIGIIPWNKGL